MGHRWKNNRAAGLTTLKSIHHKCIHVLSLFKDEATAANPSRSTEYPLTIQLTTRSTDFFVVGKMSVDLVGFVNLVGVEYQDTRGDYTTL